MRLASLLLPDLKALLKEDPDQVRDLLVEIHPEDLADLIGAAVPLVKAEADRSTVIIAVGGGAVLQSTPQMTVTELEARYGWAELGERIRIRCFTHDPSVGSSLKFLRKTPWAREKVEELYVRMRRESSP